MSNERISIVAVASMPRLGFTANFESIEQALFPLGIRLHRMQTVFWDQGMTLALENAIAAGMDWVLVLDYDSIFLADHVRRLLAIFWQRPGVHALAALQARRGGTQILASGDPNQAVDADGLIKVETAHFGLTLFRLQRFERLPRPWFRAIPDRDGSWRKGHKDSDIAFWRAWRDARNSLYVDTRTSIGHLELQTLYVTEDGDVATMGVNDWKDYQRRRFAKARQERIKESCPKSVLSPM